MTTYELSDFGGCFLTSGSRNVEGRTLAGVTAYVEWFKPVRCKGVSVTLVHGGGGQGSDFLRTPDNRPGWVHAFLKAGYAVYVLDRPGHGRNYWNTAVLGPALPAPDYETLVPRFVEPARYMLWPEASRHSQWPAEQGGSADRFMASQGPMATALTATQRHIEEIAPALFELVGDTVLVTHSAGGPCGWALSACAGDKVKAIVAVEPFGAPGLEHFQGTFENGLCAASFQGTHNPYAPPIALLTAEASWMRDMNFRAAEYLRAQGARLTHFDLPRHGITGNGHMMISELNNDRIASLVINWLDKTISSACA
jgi:pimeloyl-ACP methyl ester carboxylesterase